MVDEGSWVPPSTLDERLKNWLVPGPLYIRYLVGKARKKGEAELRLVPFLADRQRLSIDVGANKGVYSFLLARHSAGVAAFEPNPKILAVLRRWARPPIDVYAVALSDRSGRADLRIPLGARGFSNQGASLSAVKVSGPHRAVTVEMRTLDSFAFQPVGFIKIDVEGFEKEVLLGARETLARDRPRLLIEIEERHTKRPIEDDLAFVEALGYRGFFLRDRTVLTPVSALDPEREHRSAEPGRYVFNFVFIPDGCADGSRCELSIGCSFGPDRGDWSYHTSAILGGRPE